MNPTILVVEDNPSILKLSRDLLAAQGYVVATTSDPNEVVTRVENDRPRLVLMDVQLPGACGLDLARQLKSTPATKDTVILAFTALAMKEDRERALAAGCDGYISKPIRVDHFLKTVGRFLEPNEQSKPNRNSSPVAAQRLITQSQAYQGRILLIDDNPAITKLLSTVLSVEGYDIVTAPDGLSGLKEMVMTNPDLVITDVSMPGMTGFEVCRAIKEEPKTRLIPVIMVTAYGESAKKIRGIESGADDFLNKPFVQAELLARVRSLLRTKFLNDQLESAQNVILSMARVVEAKDHFTWGHTERVSRMARQLATVVGLDQHEVEALHFGGVLHDVGKIKIPDAVLNKPGALDEEEWKLVKTHPEVGAEIVKPLKSLSRVVPLILQHHERLDGSGYPNGLSAKDLSTSVRILSIVDVYDALTNKRSYKLAFTEEKASTILKEEAEAGKLDRELVQLFAETRRKVPQ